MVLSENGNAKLPLSNLAQAFETDEDIRRALDAIDEIRAYVKNIPELGDMLPAIVVVGDQSTGKSSILERLSGVNLPRGEEICTRVPLEVRMRKGECFGARIEYTGSDGEVFEEEIQDPSEAGGAIERATDGIAGEENGVVDSPITLKICGPRYQDLTVIDLPGIARVALQGQPKNIEDRTKEMIKKYILGESKVILCTFPAGMDFVTSAALQLALEADNEGVRTLGVVTKIDKDPAQIAKKLISAHVAEVKLFHGFFPVRCRSQEETENGMTLETIEELERELFRTHQDLKKLPERHHGLPALTKKLVQIQRDRLVEQLPKILNQVDDSIKAEKDELHELEGIVHDEFDAYAKARDAVVRVCRGFESIVKLEVFEKDPSLKIEPQLTNLFKAYINEVEGIEQDLHCDDLLDRVEELLEGHGGMNLPNFLSHPVFEKVMSEYVYEYLDDPALQLADDVRDRVYTIIEKLIAREMKGYPRLAHHIKGMVEEFLDNRRRSLETPIRLLMDSQKEVVIATSHYMDSLDELKNHPTQPQPVFGHIGSHKKNCSEEQGPDAWLRKVVTGLRDSSQARFSELVLSVLAYTSNIKTVLIDVVPRMIKTGIIQAVIKDAKWKGRSDEYHSLERHMTRELDRKREALHSAMFDEDEVHRKRACEDRLERLTAAKKKLKGVMTVM